MSCQCSKKMPGAVDAPHLIRPDQPCVYCAEKHFAAAMQLARECGYMVPNRQAVVGELVLAQWHTFREHYEIAELLRDLRHKIQSRQEDQIKDGWNELARSFDELISKEEKR